MPKLGAAISSTRKTQPNKNRALSLPLDQERNEGQPEEQQRNAIQRQHRAPARKSRV
jgi:hypothetical protein